MDYYHFMSRLFELLGYQGWVILVDEAELIGRFSKKARLRSYESMAELLMPKDTLRSVFTLFAFTASYIEDVIETKHDYENLAELYPGNEEPIKSVLNQIVKSQQLVPLSKSEIHAVIDRIIDFHRQAYDWGVEINRDEIVTKAKKSGALLRTKLRTAIELLDQLYQYGDVQGIQIDELSKETYTEDEIPDLIMEMMEN